MYLAIDTEFGQTEHGEHVSEVALVGAALTREWRPRAGADTRSLLREVLEELAARLIVGWQVASDMAVLARWCRRDGLPWRPPRTVCLLAEARARWKLPRYTLGAVCRALRVDMDGHKLHSAIGDARLTWAVWEAMGQRRRHVSIQRAKPAKVGSRR